ncbi:MAG: HigA family addiction module antidote protein [Symploca sp. SIO2G7]|nr:HigA family addiction module antidote protein [Symploca sp. SIO2G7]
MRRPPTHPGLMLLEEFLNEYGMTQVELSQAIYVPIQRVNEIINQKRGVTPETALKLGKYFGVSASFWLGLQKDYDLWNAYQKEKTDLDSIIPRNAIQTGLNRLLDWLDGLADSVWQPLGTFSEEALVPVRSLREGSLREKTIVEEVAQLYARDNRNEGSESPLLPSEDVSDALAYLIRSTNDESVRKDAVDLLQAIDPNHSLFSAVREKDLSLSMKGEMIILRIMVIPRVDDRYSVLVQIYSLDKNKSLPEGLKFSILDESGDEKFIYPVRPQDTLINRPLILDKGDRFSIRVTLGESTVTEAFLI